MDYNKIRRRTKKIKVGGIYIGGDSPVTVQSMTNTDTRNAAATAAQIRELENAGCDIVRVAVIDDEAAKAVYEIKNAINIPLVVDIHYDYRLAIKSIEAGADKVRINPGNIGDDSRVKAVVEKCGTRGIPIRIGVNSGSLEKDLINKYGSPTPEALAESAMNHVRLLEKFDFDNIIIAVKASNIIDTIAANKLVSELCDYPLHIGITEAGTANGGKIKSAVGIGAMLCDGIGDTLRVSLTAPPVCEVREGIEILNHIGIRKPMINLISCPTCGRTMVDIITIANEFERIMNDKNVIKINKPVTVAIMGCAVNGPGEAKEADIGIAGGKNEALLFKRGVPVRKVEEADIIRTLIDEINGEM